jgi:hypothetical protein
MPAVRIVLNARSRDAGAPMQARQLRDVLLAHRLSQTVGTLPERCLRAAAVCSSACAHRKHGRVQVCVTRPLPRRRHVNTVPGLS